MPTSPSPPPLITVMGVSGSGKTTVGAALAQRLGVPFADADDFHPAANVAKMSAGTPLDDADRLPWLRDDQPVAGRPRRHRRVVSCSALKRWYRDILRDAAPTQFFVHLDGSPRRRRPPGGGPPRTFHAGEPGRLPVRHPGATGARRGRYRPQPRSARG